MAADADDMEIHSDLVGGEVWGELASGLQAEPSPVVLSSLG